VVDARTGLTLAGALALAGCAILGDGNSGVSRRSNETCSAGPAQRFVGQFNTTDTGAAILAATGASSLRWVPLGTTVTTEQAPGSVFVIHDKEFRIMQVTCG
jgi:hypothetical protein